MRISAQNSEKKKTRNEKGFGRKREENTEGRGWLHGGEGSAVNKRGNRPPYRRYGKSRSGKKESEKWQGRTCQITREKKERKDALNQDMGRGTFALFPVEEGGLAKRGVSTEGWEPAGEVIG